MSTTTTVTTDSPIAVALLRVSTEDQASSGLGLDDQRAACERWAQSKGVRLAAVREEHVSGKAPLEGRAGLLAALADVRALGARYLLVLRRDRLARDPLVALLAEREAATAGAQVVTADGLANGDDPGSELTRGVLDAVARFEAGMVRERTRAALGAKRRRGQWTGRPPWGHRIGDDGRLEVLPEAEPTVARVRELRAEGASIRAIAAALDREGHRRAAGDGPGARWHRGNVHSLLRALDH